VEPLLKTSLSVFSTQELWVGPKGLGKIKEHTFTLTNTHSSSLIILRALLGEMTTIMGARKNILAFTSGLKGSTHLGLVKSVLIFLQITLFIGRYRKEFKTEAWNHN
jgi:hypothetical protein